MNYKSIISKLLISIALIIVVINTSYNIYTSTHNTYEYLFEDTSACEQLYREIDKKTTYSVQGKSKTDWRIDEWYYIEGCNRVLIYVRLMKPLTNTTKAIVLIHDYGTNYLSTLGLALELVSRNYTVLQIDLPIPKSERVKLLDNNYTSSWIYTSVCNTMKALTLLTSREENVTSIGLIGIGFGGVVALITARYDNRVNYAVSIAGLGNYKRSIRMGSLINYYIDDLNDANPCLDSVYLIKDINKKILVVIGTEDEINPLDPVVFNTLANNSNIYISIVPHANRFRIPIDWINVVYKFIESIDKTNSKEDVEVTNNFFELTIKTDSPGEFLVLEKPLFFNTMWRTSTVDYFIKKYSYFIVPGEYIVIDKSFYSVYGCFVTSGFPGLVLACLLIVVWLVINKQSIVYYLRNSSIIHYLYIASIITMLFYIYYPTLWFSNRFHTSLYSTARLYSSLFPILSSLILLIPFINIVALTLFFNKVKFRKLFYTLYVGVPLFILVFTYLFLLFIGTRFYYTTWGLPTFSIIPLVSVSILHYIITTKYE